MNELVKGMLSLQASGDPRVAQARRYFDLGYGRALGFPSFEVYLATVPEIPEHLVAYDPAFDILALVDPRLPRTVRCRLVSLRYKELGYDDGSWFPCDERHETTTMPFWIRAHDGRRNRSRRPSICLADCTGNVFGGVVDVGIALYTHQSGIVVEDEHVMRLPGSVLRDSREGHACLEKLNGEARLVVNFSDGANPKYGTVTFRQ